MFIEMLTTLSDGIADIYTITPDSNKNFYDDIVKRFVVSCIILLEDLEDLVTNTDYGLKQLDNSNLIAPILKDIISQIHQLKTLLQELVKLPADKMFSSPKGKLILVQVLQIKNNVDQLKQSLKLLKEDNGLGLDITDESDENDETDNKEL